ncbi:FtsX-like permease family protein [Nitratireductor soli]|uniref:FtsX-like permease family protein n=1 Tax=Nitratireductor soli TaxID=1670619 RepID=UPI00065E31C6|nr:FtsX-like permease family protein [Nitratireductor soli]
MPDILSDWWNLLAPGVQDALWFALLFAPALLTGVAVTRGYRPYGLAGAMLWRFRWASLLFALLIATSIGIGVGLIAQERALRQGTARAAEKFDLVVSAPGSEVTMLMAAVYLQPSDVPLLSGEIYDQIAGHPDVALAAPIAFGDSHAGAPVVGTTQAFIAHLAGDLLEGRAFADPREAVAGFSAPVAPGGRFTADHGIGDAVEQGAHAGHEYTVVGRMRRTGSPWDRAILVPVEAVWAVHGLADGHAPENAGRLGPPFDPAYFPGTPAILVHAEALWANYALQSEFTRADTMAFFPGAVLARLHGLLGDVRRIMSVLAIVTQMLVAAGVLTGLVILTRLFSRQLALLRALGAERRFVFAVVWCVAAALVAVGALLGVALGLAAAGIISRIVSARTEILIEASLAWPEFHLVAAFVSATILMALMPAAIVLARPVVPDLRG